jgi:hypothetical protein
VGFFTAERIFLFSPTLSLATKSDLFMIRTRKRKGIKGEHRLCLILLPDYLSFKTTEHILFVEDLFFLNRQKHT